MTCPRRAAASHHAESERGTAPRTPHSQRSAACPNALHRLVRSYPHRFRSFAGRDLSVKHQWSGINRGNRRKGNKKRRSARFRWALTDRRRSDILLGSFTEPTGRISVSRSSATHGWPPCQTTALTRCLQMRRWFLSYNSSDRALAEGLKDAIQRKDLGSQVFFDSRAWGATRPRSGRPTSKTWPIAMP
jgi:hypothetical protein